jgi:transcriptional regulator with XRE-family HTH domain
MTLHSREALVNLLKDKNFRDSFVTTRVDGGTAFQIRYMREKEGWTQQELARRLGTSQNSVFRLESPNYGRANLTTLKRLASVFDVALVVRFVRFSELVDHVTNLSTESVTVDSFDEDRGIKETVGPRESVERDNRASAQSVDWSTGQSRHSGPLRPIENESDERFFQIPPQKEYQNEAFGNSSRQG